MTSRKVSNSSQITYAMLQEHFHLPINEVAKELGVCATVLKKICRQHGIPRWPHRKIKSLNKKILLLEQQKTTSEDEENERLIELRSLQRTKAEIIDNPSCIGPTYSHIAPGKPMSPIGKYGAGRRASHENLLREQSVRAILQRQRKYSAPDASFGSNLKNMVKNSELKEQQVPISIPNYYSRDYSPQPPSEPIIRSSCPAVLEGLSVEQLGALNSIVPDPNYNFTNTNFDDYGNQSYSSQPPIQYNFSNYRPPISSLNYESPIQIRSDYPYSDNARHSNIPPPQLAPIGYNDNNSLKQLNQNSDKFKVSFIQNNQFNHTLPPTRFDQYRPEVRNNNISNSGNNDSNNSGNTNNNNNYNYQKSTEQLPTLYQERRNNFQAPNQYQHPSSSSQHKGNIQ